MEQLEEVKDEGFLNLIGQRQILVISLVKLNLHRYYLPVLISKLFIVYWLLCNLVFYLWFLHFKLLGLPDNLTKQLHVDIRRHINDNSLDG